MRRRAYLALVAVGFAGCGSQTTDGGTPTPTDATPTETDTPTRTPTPAGTPTPTPAQAPEDALPALEWWLTRAFEAYAPEGTSFGSVTAATEVDVATATEHLAEADAVRASLEDAGLSGDRRERYRNLAGVYHFLDRVVEIHDHLRTAWTNQGEAWDVVLAQEGNPGPGFQSVNAAADAARADINELVADSDPEDTASFPPLLTGDYENKVAQLDTEITTFVDLVDAMQSFNSAMGDADRGIVHYENGSYTSSSIGFENAANAFQSVTETFATGWPEHFQSTTDDAFCTASAMESGCRRMAQIARAVADGQEEDPQAAKESARSRFEQCALVFEHNTLMQEFYS